MDNFFSVLSLSSDFSLDPDFIVGNGDSDSGITGRRFLVGSELPVESDVRLLASGADVVSKHLLDDKLPFVVVLFDDCGVGGFTRIFENVYLCSLSYSILCLGESSFYLVNHAFCESCLSLEVGDVPFNVFRSVSLPLLLSSRWVTRQYKENGFLCYVVSRSDGVVNEESVL